MNARAAIRCCVLCTLCALCASEDPAAFAADPAEKLQVIDAKREELRQKLAQAQREPNRMYRRTHLAETHMKLMFLDYDDPRTELGAAVAMSNVSNEHLVEIMYEMTLNRKPTMEETKQCLTHMAKHADEPRRVTEEIIWALCNTREFVERIDK